MSSDQPRLNDQDLQESGELARCPTWQHSDGRRPRGSDPQRRLTAPDLVRPGDRLARLFPRRVLDPDPYDLVSCVEVISYGSLDDQQRAAAALRSFVRPGRSPGPARIRSGITSSAGPLATGRRLDRASSQRPGSPWSPSAPSVSSSAPGRSSGSCPGQGSGTTRPPTQRRTPSTPARCSYTRTAAQRRGTRCRRTSPSRCFSPLEGRRSRPMPDSCSGRTAVTS